jgi:hypothetical protein
MCSSTCVLFNHVASISDHVAFNDRMTSERHEVQADGRGFNRAAVMVFAWTY